MIDNKYKQSEFTKKLLININKKLNNEIGNNKNQSGQSRQSCNEYLREIGIYQESTALSSLLAEVNNISGNRVGNPDIDNSNEVLNRTNVDISTNEPIYVKSNNRANGNIVEVGSNNGMNTLIGIYNANILYEEENEINNSLISINNREEKDDGNETIMCTICQDYITDIDRINNNVTILACGHQFHKPEILQWYEYNTTCPICKKKIDINIV
jgi:hypothetical protein